MRIDSTLNVTPEGSLSDLPAAMGGVEESRREQETWQTSEKEMQDVCPSTTVVTSTEETLNTFVKTVSGRDLSEQGLNQIEPPRKVLRTREASREEAIALTGQFFATVNGQNPVETSEPHTETPIATSEGNVTLNLNIPVTSATPTITETETRGPRTFLSNGLPSRPTATATCRPWMWVQCVSEGQINEPPQEDTGSAGSSSTEPYLLAEGIPENLGCEWRILTPLKFQE